MRSELEELLATAVRNRASHLHFAEGLPPVFRVDGQLRQETESVIRTGAEVEALILPALPKPIRSGLVDGSLSEAAATLKYDRFPQWEFDLDIFREKRGFLAAAFRLVPRQSVPEAAVDRTFITILVYLHSGEQARFREYEEQAVPLMWEYGGRVETMYRPKTIAGAGDLETPDEVHVLSFATPDGYRLYRSDPRSAEIAHLREASVKRVVFLTGDSIPFPRP